MYDQIQSINKEKKKAIKIIIISIIIILSFFVGLIIGASNEKQINTIGGSSKILNKNSQPNTIKNINFKLFWEVWELIKEKYVDPEITDSNMFYGAQAGLVASLGDPYSMFLEPTIAKDFSDELQGKFEGIGAELSIKNDKLVIVAPLPNSPALKSGLRAGDHIVAINDIDSSLVSLNGAVNMIRGDKGTKVKLTVIHKGETEEKEYEITRDEIIYESVKWEIKNNNIGYIKITHFNQDTEELFEKAVNDLLNKKINSIIIDLRNNPGGYLTSAIKISSYWIDDGVIVKEVFRDKEQTKNYSSNSVSKLKGKKTVILINGGSASASEIVAGALQDYKLATLVGEQTFGKGSVQDLTELSDGSSVKLTIAKWFTPLDRSIDEEGIVPDIIIELTGDDYNKDRDPQLDKALELLK